MPLVEDSIPVTIPLSKRVFEKAADSAERAHRSIEDQLADLVASGLSSEVTVDQALDEAYQAYLSHTRREGRKPQTTAELWEQMRRIRKEITDELDTR